MGVTATEGQVDNLLRIQREFGVECSMTINSLSIPLEIAADPMVMRGFIDFIGGFYEKGVRSCTLSNTHLMRVGVLQNEFPEMRWKNTVNQQVKSVQELYDYAGLGYNTICFDRSLNRDIETLTEVYREAKKLDIEVSLLASEGCLPSCPFKTEHDSWQEKLQKSPQNYWQTFSNTCTGWRARADAQMPRLGTDINMATEELFELFMENTDILKFSGRMNAPSIVSKAAMCWAGVSRTKTRTGEEVQDIQEFEYADSVKEIYEKKLAPYLVSRWTPGWTLVDDKHQFDITDKDSIWLTKKGRGLSKLLSSCKNRCWDCHACEKVFGVEEFNSVLSI
jgi:collagenase-like PrtC family protease